MKFWKCAFLCDVISPIRPKFSDETDIIDGSDDDNDNWERLSEFSSTDDSDSDSDLE